MNVRMPRRDREQRDPDPQWQYVLSFAVSILFLAWLAWHLWSRR